MASEESANQPILRVGDREETTVGNYFVANYPPFSFWTPDALDAVTATLDTPAPEEALLGLYIHIPFCRKRCNFCYFKVYTGKNSKDVRDYVDAVLAEADLYAQKARIAGRRARFVYFGGGTPSFLSVAQMERLFGGLRERFDWSDVEEVTFECEPGTLEESKIRVLRELGVTRLSLGVENFDSEILELNNRAHRAKEVHQTYALAREVGFPQINIDLIAGMVGETDENWADCIEHTRALAPESVTIYQMEIPYNTTIYREMKDGGQEIAPVADWATKRRWVKEAFAALEEDDYIVGSAYTVKKNAEVSFQYRDGLWNGADLLGLGVSSFSHVGGIHFQNEHHLEPYQDRIASGEIPVHRGLTLSDDERLVREFILQMKLGVVDLGYFRNKFGVEIRDRFADQLAMHVDAGRIAIDGDRLTSTRDTLLEIDRHLQDFFRPEHQDARYA